MKTFEFLQNFPNEQSCKVHFKDNREKMGRVKCKDCGCLKHYWLQAK